MRELVVFVYIVAFLVAIASVVSIPQEVWRSMSFGQTLAFGFSLLVGFCGVLLAYFVYVDGAILENLKKTSISEVHENRETSSAGFSVAFSIAHVKVTNGERQYGELKSKRGSTRENMITDVVSEAQTLIKAEFLEITCASNVATDIKEVLKERLGNDYKVSHGFPSEKGSVLYVEKV